jgi:hypothetical protein
MQESFKESFLATSNTKLAAVYRFFEIRLPRFNPAIVAEVFKWSDLKNGYKDPKPPRRVIWKFEADSKAREITRAYESKTAHQEFGSYLDELALSQLEREKLESLHSGSIAQAARELFESREHLLDILKSVPDSVLWQVIIEDSGRVRSMFPKAASPETKAKFFERDL